MKLSQVKDVSAQGSSAICQTCGRMHLLPDAVLLSNGGELRPACLAVPGCCRTGLRAVTWRDGLQIGANKCG